MALHVEQSANRSSEAPFPPSWIDRLIQWIDHLRSPVWLSYLLSVLAALLLINVILWIDGSVPLGSADTIDVIFPPFVIYPLALYHYLTGIGSRSLQTFRSLLDVDDSEVANIDYELATLPRWLGWLAVPLGLGLAVLVVLGDPTAFGDLVPQTALPYVAAIAVFGFSAARYCAESSGASGSSEWSARSTRGLRTSTC